MRRPQAALSPAAAVPKCAPAIRRRCNTSWSPGRRTGWSADCAPRRSYRLVTASDGTFGSKPGFNEEKGRRFTVAALATRDDVRRVCQPQPSGFRREVHIHRLNGDAARPSEAVDDEIHAAEKSAGQAVNLGLHPDG